MDKKLQDEKLFYFNFYTQDEWINCKTKQVQNRVLYHFAKTKSILGNQCTNIVILNYSQV